MNHATLGLDLQSPRICQVCFASCSCSVGTPDRPTGCQRCRSRHPWHTGHVALPDGEKLCEKRPLWQRNLAIWPGVFGILEWCDDANIMGIRESNQNHPGNGTIVTIHSEHWEHGKISSVCQLPTGRRRWRRNPSPSPWRSSNKRGSWPSPRTSKLRRRSGRRGSDGIFMDFWLRGAQKTWWENIRVWWFKHV